MWIETPYKKEDLLLVGKDGFDLLLFKKKIRIQIDAHKWLGLAQKNNFLKADIQLEEVIDQQLVFQLGTNVSFSLNKEKISYTVFSWIAQAIKFQRVIEHYEITLLFSQAYQIYLKATLEQDSAFFHLLKKATRSKKSFGITAILMLDVDDTLVIDQILNVNLPAC